MQNINIWELGGKYIGVFVCLYMYKILDNKRLIN